MSRELPPAESAFVKAMKEAMDEYTRMRQQGVSKQDACEGLKQMLMDKFKPRHQRDRRAESAGRDDEPCW